MDNTDVTGDINRIQDFHEKMRKATNPPKKKGWLSQVADRFMKMFKK